MRNDIDELIHRELVGNDQIVANELVKYLHENNLEFYRDESNCWKNKIYFWVKYQGACVCFIAINDPDEPDNRWTVWSADICSEYLSDKSVDETLKQVAFNSVDECGHCGSCGGGSSKIIFGREFDAVCGCTFRLDNPKLSDLPFIKYMISATVKQINKT